MSIYAVILTILLSVASNCSHGCGNRFVRVEPDKCEDSIGDCTLSLTLAGPHRVFRILVDLHGVHLTSIARSRHP